jgi:hypothetical protein
LVHPSGEPVMRFACPGVPPRDREFA